MTPRVPLRLCRKCPHYHGYCPLQDLEPCVMREPQNDYGLSKNSIAVLIVVTIFSALLLFFGCKVRKEEAPEPVQHVSVVQLLRQQHRAELSEWEMLQMAIILTESRFNPDATGAAHDAGLYQMTPVYVAEVNRVAGTDYVHADAYDPDKAVAMFSLMQGHYNPGRDTDLAIYFHNKSEAYRQRVLKNLETIRRYEAARKAVTK